MAMLNNQMVKATQHLAFIVRDTDFHQPVIQPRYTMWSLPLPLLTSGNPIRPAAYIYQYHLMPRSTANMNHVVNRSNGYQLTWGSSDSSSATHCLPNLKNPASILSDWKLNPKSGKITLEVQGGAPQLYLPCFVTSLSIE